MMEEPRCTMTVTGRHKWDSGKAYVYLGEVMEFDRPKKCTACGMIDDREEVSDK